MRGLAFNFASTYQAENPRGFSQVGKNKQLLIGIVCAPNGKYQVLQPIFEADFQKHSYGFRPNRNAHQALQQSLENINSGYQDIVDIDLKSFPPAGG